MEIGRKPSEVTSASSVGPISDILKFSPGKLFESWFLGCICTDLFCSKVSPHVISFRDDLWSWTRPVWEIRISGPLSQHGAVLLNCVIMERSLPWREAKDCSWRRSHLTSVCCCLGTFLLFTEKKTHQAVFVNAALLSGRKKMGI